MTATRMLRNALHTFSHTFSPLAIRNMRLYLGGQTISLVGTWMQSTAQAWVVWQISHSTVDLGVNAMLSLLPFLVLGPWIGSVADRFDRRRLLIATQTVSMILAATLALLVQSQTVQLWHVDLLALLLGIVNTLDLPSQQTFIGDLSGKQKLREAVVLNAMIWQVSRMVGPAFAGWVIGAIGVALTFWLNALSFIPVIASLALVKTDPQPHSRPTTALNDFRQAIRFIRTEPRVQDMLIFTGLAAT
ncbi:MAG TPA: MFS transporter, partial [Aggregatilineales bacterium]|nr:MFS transporter [Aggregatilineales bacterium]